MSDENYAILLAKKEAEYWEKKTHICEDTILLMADAIQKKWTRCDERLPSMEVIACSTDGVMMVGNVLTDHASSTGFRVEDTEQYMECVAWMPLPEPYKGD